MTLREVIHLQRCANLMESARLVLETMPRSTELTQGQVSLLTELWAQARYLDAAVASVLNTFGGTQPKKETPA